MTNLARGLGTVGSLLPFLIAASCSSTSTPAPEPPFVGPAEWNRDVTSPDDTAAATSRASCTFKAGALPAETHGKTAPQGKQIPIDHIVVVMMENRSFDHYFQAAKASAGLDVDVAPEGFTNPDPEGKPVAPFHDKDRCFIDTAHGWESIRDQIGGGKMDGFVMSNEGQHELPAAGTPDMLRGNRAMAYYTEAEIPFAYWMAKNFAIGDRYFASLPTATWPNRMFLYAATSFGKKSNDFPDGEKVTIFDRLNERKISWRVYAQTTPTFAIIVDKFFELRAEEGRFSTMTQYFKDAADGTLPQVVFLDPDGTSSPDVLHSDEHPPAPATLGQTWIAKAVDALAKGPQWERSAMFITYDEHGGLFDHVAPPKACPPDDRALDETDQKIFGSYGVRVPFFVVSPFAKKGFVSHKTYDHSSITRFIEARFVLPAMSNRDANAEAPFDAFDFANPPSKAAPSVPVPAVNEQAVSECKAIWKL